MKKILFVINTMGRGGAEVALLELLRCLGQEKDLEISLFVLTGQGELLSQVSEDVYVLNSKYNAGSVLTSEGKRNLTQSVLKACFTNGTLFKLFPYLIVQLADMIKKKRIQLDKLVWRVLSDGAERFDEKYDLAIAYIEGGATYYVMDHVNADKKVAFYHTNYIRAGYTRKLDKDCYLKYDKIFTVSEDVKKILLEIYPEISDKTEIFNNIINRDRILNMAELPGGFMDEYMGQRILTLGRLTEPKDFAQSILAMKLLKEQGINARWYILGEGDQRAELENLIRKLDLEQDFFLVGAVDNPYNYLKQADIYVHATRYEGKSVAIQEAQILGKPILVSNCSSNREQVVDGVDGMLCELTPEAICTGVKELLSDKEKQLKYGVMAAKRQMTESREIEKLLSLLTKA